MEEIRPCSPIVVNLRVKSNGSEEKEKKNSITAVIFIPPFLTEEDLKIDLQQLDFIIYYRRHPTSPR